MVRGSLTEAPLGIGKFLTTNVPVGGKERREGECENLKQQDVESTVLLRSVFSSVWRASSLETGSSFLKAGSTSLEAGSSFLVAGLSWPSWLEAVSSSLEAGP